MQLLWQGRGRHCRLPPPPRPFRDNPVLMVTTGGAPTYPPSVCLAIFVSISSSLSPWVLLIKTRKQEEQLRAVALPVRAGA